LDALAVFYYLKKLFYTPHGYAFLRTDTSSFTKKLYRIIESSFQRIFGGATIACGDKNMESPNHWKIASG
jgi:hypothetical protein